MGANYAAEAFQSLNYELDLIWTFVNDNRTAFEALPAVQGGVCAIIGEGCTYFPPESGNVGNLTRVN